VQVLSTSLLRVLEREQYVPERAPPRRRPPSARRAAAPPAGLHVIDVDKWWKMPGCSESRAPTNERDGEAALALAILSS